MYNKTDKQHIIYCINKKYYKIPTFGRIIKIIDFGRAIINSEIKLYVVTALKQKVTQPPNITLVHVSTKTSHN